MTNSFPASRYLRHTVVWAATGAADSSFSAGVFKPTLDGLGLIGGNAHSLDEYAEPDSFVPRLYLLTRMVMELGKSGVRQ